MNLLIELHEYLIYSGFYEGGEVGLGDFNNDGLQDIFFAGNFESDSLYINITKYYPNKETAFKESAADGLYLDQKMMARAKELCYPNPEFLDLPKWDRMGWLK